jgi:hypothetical protein
LEVEVKREMSYLLGDRKIRVVVSTVVRKCPIPPQLDFCESSFDLIEIYLSVGALHTLYVCMHSDPRDHKNIDIIILDFDESLTTQQASNTGSIRIRKL